MSRIRFISAGAGSGKTYRITELIEERLRADQSRPEAVIATTFTRKAAGELEARVRQRMFDAGEHQLAMRLGQARFGTVNSVCGQLLSHYAFEAGLSPRLETLPEEDAPGLFNQALDEVLELSRVRKMNALAARLGQEDWRETVKSLVDTARANNLEPDAIVAQAEDSIREVLDLLPPAYAGRDLDAELSDVLDGAVAGIRANTADTTKTTAEFLDRLENARRVGPEALPWADWARLATKAPGKKSEALSAPVHDISTEYEHHPRLKSDLEAWIRGVFETACEALERYQDLKAERGLMDYVDQERLVLGLLDNPEVTASLHGQIDLLVVDEFQDTSPIQLAVFLKLAELAEEVIWVGDIKQAIYSFRGSDPELIQAVLQGLHEQGAQDEILEYSWRSRPGLVEFTNSLFVPAFPALDAEQIQLKPKRADYPGPPPLAFWTLEGSNKADRWGAMAIGIRDLLASGATILDRQTDTLRPVEPGDIAILCRTNSSVSELAATLTGHGIAVSVSEAGLLATPEGTLALACLRRMYDRSDTLATAEIVALQATHHPEEWLASRLDHLERGGDPTEWNFDLPIIERLDEERHQLAYMTPTEALDHALAVGDVRQTLLTWGPDPERSAQRLANLEAVRQYASQYEAHCGRSQQAATVAGLLLWLQQLVADEADVKGRSEAGAVEVTTHHRGKGLEWPIVVCADLDSAPKTRVWDLTVTSDAEVSFDAPLARRRIRYWPWPFGPLSSKIPFKDRAEGSDFGKQAAEQANEEAKRLLYVSMTRARDQLILALSGKARHHPWLGLLEAEWLTPEESFTLSDGTRIDCEVRTLEAREPTVVTSDERLQWFSEFELEPDHTPLHRLPSAEPATDVGIGQIINLGQRLPVQGQPDVTQLGNVLHAAIAAEVTSPRQRDRRDMVSGLLVRHGLENHLESDDVLDQIDHLLSAIHETFQPTALYAEHPVHVVWENGQQGRGWIDLLLETERGLVIIDHKALLDGQTAWADRALAYSGQLKAYATAITHAEAGPVAGCWLALPVAGGLVELDLERL